MSGEGICVCVYVCMGSFSGIRFSFLFEGVYRGVCVCVCVYGGGGSAGNKVLTTLREMRPLWKFHSSGISQPCGDVCGEISVSPSPEPGVPFDLFSFFHFIRLF